MNRYKRIHNIRLFYKAFREGKDKLLNDRYEMWRFKKNLRFHTGYTTKKVDKLIDHWFSMDIVQSHYYLKYLDHARNEEWEKEQRRLFKIGRRCK